MDWIWLNSKFLILTLFKWEAEGWHESSSSLSYLTTVVVEFNYSPASVRCRLAVLKRFRKE